MRFFQSSYFTPCLHCMLSVCMFSLRKTSARLLNATRLFSGVWFRDPSPKRKQTHFFWRYGCRSGFVLEDVFFLDIFHHITPCVHCMWSVCMFTLRKTSARLLNAARLFSGILAPSENRRIFLEVWLQIWLRIRRCVFFWIF